MKKKEEDSLAVLAEILEAIRERLDEIKALQATSVTALKELKENLPTTTGLKELRSSLNNITNSLSIINEVKQYMESIDSKYNALVEEVKSLGEKIEEVKALTSESMKKSVKLLEQAMELLNLPDIVNQIAGIVNDLTVKVAELSKTSQENVAQDSSESSSEEV
ncbi:MAG: hypothetical protein ACTSXW_04450 [Candidatus Baldrarchaeia archaeon]